LLNKTDPEKRRFPSRRDVLRILAVGGAAGVAWKLGLFGRAALQPVTRSRVLMGTVVRLTVLGDDRDAAAAAADATLERMADLEALLSRHRDDSEVSQLNAGRKIDRASDALLDVLRLADRISRLGDGAFDVTVQPVLDLRRGRREPGAEEIDRVRERVDYRAIRITDRSVALERPEMGITLDGIGKGYVVDRGVDVLKTLGFTDVFVEAGGDLVASGDKGDGVPWRVGIRAPRAGLKLQATFDARDRAVATSGDYMQPFNRGYTQHHIVDPRTGHSAPELASSTVIAPDAATADALATLVMVLGPQRGRELLEDLAGCEGYLISKELEVTRTSGFKVV